MFLRTLLLLALAFGLAAGPTLPAVVCGKNEPGMKCGNCCAKEGAACCKGIPAPTRNTPSQVTASSVDLKQAVVPVLVCLGTQPGLIVPPVSLQQRALTRYHGQRRLDVTCIRLI